MDKYYYFNIKSFNPSKPDLNIFVNQIYKISDIIIYPNRYEYIIYQQVTKEINTYYIILYMENASENLTEYTQIRNNLINLYNTFNSANDFISPNEFK